MALWNPRKPLTQPPSYQRIGLRSGCARNEDQAGRAAQRALNEAQFARGLATQRVGGRRAIVAE